VVSYCVAADEADERSATAALKAAAAVVVSVGTISCKQTPSVTDFALAMVASVAIGIRAKNTLIVLSAALADAQPYSVD